MTLLEMVEMSLDELKERLKNEKEENDKKVLITAVQNLKKGMYIRKMFILASDFYFFLFFI